MVRCVTNNALGDLAVAESAGGERGDAALAGGEGVDAGHEDAARAGPGGHELLVRPVGERARAAAVGEVEARDAAARAPHGARRPGAGRAVVGQRAGELEAGARALERATASRSSSAPLGRAGHQTGRAERDAERARRAELARERDLLGGEPDARHRALPGPRGRVPPPIARGGTRSRRAPTRQVGVRRPGSPPAPRAAARAPAARAPRACRKHIHPQYPEQRLGGVRMGRRQDRRGVLGVSPLQSGEGERRAGDGHPEPPAAGCCERQRLLRVGLGLGDRPATVRHVRAEAEGHLRRPKVAAGAALGQHPVEQLGRLVVALAPHQRQPDVVRGVRRDARRRGRRPWAAPAPPARAPRRRAPPPSPAARPGRRAAGARPGSLARAPPGARAAPRSCGSVDCSSQPANVRCASSCSAAAASRSASAACAREKTSTASRVAILGEQRVAERLRRRRPRAGTGEQPLRLAEVDDRRRLRLHADRLWCRDRALRPRVELRRPEREQHRRPRRPAAAARRARATDTGPRPRALRAAARPPPRAAARPPRSRVARSGRHGAGARPRSPARASSARSNSAAAAWRRARAPAGSALYTA